MTDHETQEQTDETQTEGGPSEAPNPEQPDENTAPPSNPDADPDRVEREEEDADRTIAS
jgi:hypothetical protein